MKQTKLDVFEKKKVKKVDYKKGVKQWFDDAVKGKTVYINTYFEPNQSALSELIREGTIQRGERGGYVYKGKKIRYHIGGSSWLSEGEQYLELE